MALFKSPGTPHFRRDPVVRTGWAQSHYYRDLGTALWSMRGQIPYAWNLLTHSACDCYSLESYDLRGRMFDHVHLCMKRIQALKLNTMPALDPSALREVAKLSKFTPSRLASLGRLARPMIRRRGERGFVAIDWVEAFNTVCKTIRDTAPHRMAFCAGPQGLTNEVYYVFQKLARALGTNNVNLCARKVAATGVDGLKATLGIAAPTCSLTDLIGSDLLMIFGTDLSDDFPLTSRYLRRAKKAGAQIIAVNPHKVRHWSPSVTRNSLFATNLVDEFFQISAGGEIAFINGVLKELVESKRIEQEFIDQHTAGFRALKAALARQSWDSLGEQSGVPRGQIQRCADLFSQARTAGILYGSGFTQGGCGTDNVKAIVNLALSRAMIGRPKSGIVPVDNQSSAQGASDCGSVADKFPGGLTVNDDNARRFSNLWYHPVPSSRGLNAAQIVDSAHRGAIDFLYSIGGDLNDIELDPDFIASALSKVRLRVHQDTALNPPMLAGAEEAVLLLPSQTSFEQHGGGTTTNPERKIRFTREISGHTIGESRPAWDIPVQIGRRAMPNGEKLFPFNDSQSIREEMARVMPLYLGIEKLHKENDQLQWGGPILFKGGFTNMPNHRALFSVLDPPNRRAELVSGEPDDNAEVSVEKA